MKNFFKQFGRSPSAEPQPTPVEPAYRWIVDNQLAVGPIPDAILYEQLRDAGFKSVLTLCAETERSLPAAVAETFNWQRMVLPDHSYEETMKATHLAPAVAFVDAAIRQQQAPVYVHCLAGMERSPSVCVAYLCLHQKMEVWEALNWVKQRNRRTNLNSNQVQAIQDLARSQPTHAAAPPTV
jgi:atypical dual specificity phosphatase